MATARVSVLSATAAVWLLLTVLLRAADPVPAAPAPQPVTARAVPVKYFVSLPKGWSAERTWPILVTIDGAGHDFAGNFQNFTRARGDQPFIIVTPCVSSNGNDPADAKAVLAIVQEVQQASHGQAKFFMTGFSAGGHVTWQIILQHPELLAGAVLAAANFRFRGITDVSQDPARVQLPIQAFQGDKDGNKAAFDQQWDDAQQLAQKNGYTKLTRTIVPGAGHQAFPGQVIATCAAWLPK